MEKIRNSKLSHLIFVGIFMLYLIAGIWIGKIDSKIVAIIDLIVYLLFGIFAIFIMKGKFKSSFQDLKNTKKTKIIKYIIATLLIIFVVNLGTGIASNVIKMLNGQEILGETQNDELINSILKEFKESTWAMIYFVTVTIIIGPLFEETIFRGCLRSGINNKFLFMIISGILFGAGHLIGYSYENFVAIICDFLPYFGMGLVFGYTYTEKDNIILNFLIHALNNTIAIVLSLCLI